jgi:ABC-type multidrug transport system fused ATPase/permease subunit
MMQIHRAIPSLNEEGAINLKSWSQISLKDISFKYREEEVLDNFNFSFKKGQKIGIVGRSGSGKSTLFKLLLKLYLPKEGMIYFDNVPVTGIKRDSILEKISIVPQETELFNLSFKDNIIISNPGKVDYAKYSKAIRISQCVPVIAKLKNKDLTLIGEKGVRLSGGERQRLGIARAIYKDSEIIIFDEATSNLDYETEKNILESMEKELKDKTLIISAHRLSTLRGVENIIIIDKGKIVEQGKYEELLRKRGQFYRLWRQQEAWRD